MPNWCGNTLTLSHDDPEMIVRATKAFEEGRLLDEFIPVPPGLKGTTSPNRDGTAEELRAQYGYSDWYDFCVNEWGTKWDVGSSQGIQDVDKLDLIVYFDSAWAPPIAAYQSLENQGFRVYATYYEPGCAFAGIYDECGDNCYNLSDMSSDEVRDEIPSELDDAFGISESMAQYEAENEDEVTQWYKEGVEATGLEPHKVKDEQ